MQGHFLFDGRMLLTSLGQVQFQVLITLPSLQPMSHFTCLGLIYCPLSNDMAPRSFVSRFCRCTLNDCCVTDICSCKGQQQSAWLLLFLYINVSLLLKLVHFWTVQGLRIIILCDIAFNILNQFSVLSPLISD